MSTVNGVTVGWARNTGFGGCGPTLLQRGHGSRVPLRLEITSVCTDLYLAKHPNTSVLWICELLCTEMMKLGISFILVLNQKSKTLQKWAVDSQTSHLTMGHGCQRQKARSSMEAIPQRVRSILVVSKGTYHTSLTLSPSHSSSSEVGRLSPDRNTVITSTLHWRNDPEQVFP